MKTLGGVIFDCDGVLFESHAANLAYYNQVLEQLEEPTVSEAQVERARLCHTAASSEVFRQLLGEERVDEAMALAARVEYGQFLHHMHPQPDMVETLRELSARLPLAVATNRGTSMPEILSHFELQHYFQAVVTSRDVARPKPAPDMLLLAAKRLGISPYNSLFVGDSILDRDAARAAGMPFVGYQNQAQGEWNIEHHRQLGEIVRKLCMEEGTTRTQGLSAGP